MRPRDKHGLGERTPIRMVPESAELRGLLEWHEKVVRRGFLQGLGLGNVRQSASCVEDIDWGLVASGVLPRSKTRELIEHAAKCARCAPKLRNAVVALADNASQEEEAFISNLRTAQPEWQQEMAETMQGRNWKVKVEHLSRLVREWIVRHW